MLGQSRQWRHSESTQSECDVGSESDHISLSFCDSKIEYKSEEDEIKSRQLKIFRAAGLSAAASPCYSCGKLNCVTL